MRPSTPVRRGSYARHTDEFPESQRAAGAGGRPKYLDKLEASLRRTAAQLEKRRIWLSINNGDTGEVFASLEDAGGELARAVADLDKLFHNRLWMGRNRKSPAVPS